MKICTNNYFFFHICVQLFFRPIELFVDVRRANRFPWTTHEWQILIPGMIDNSRRKWKSSRIPVKYVRCVWWNIFGIERNSRNEAFYIDVMVWHAAIWWLFFRTFNYSPAACLLLSCTVNWILLNTKNNSQKKKKMKRKWTID